MDISTYPRRSTALITASLVGVAALLLAPAPAQASRPPADPIITFVPTPTAVSRLIVEAQAANVRAALDDLRSAQAT